jgi:hypothetical protein
MLPHAALIPTFVEPLNRVVRKFFPLDKNYLLEEAQIEQQDQLLRWLLDRVKSSYFELFNPLGIDDAISARIKKFRGKDVSGLNNFYQHLAAIYRLKHGETQLTFLWDGIDHREKYRAEWAEVFEGWVHEFCRSELFIRAVLDLTVFLPDNRNAQLVESRMNHFIMQRFEVRMHKQRGLVQATRVA